VLAHQAGFFEQAEMTGHGWPAYWQLRRDFAYRFTLSAEQRQDAPTVLVAQRIKRVTG
jgi:hypothetical protein